MKYLNIGLFGYGIVGEGVYQLINNSRRIFKEEEEKEEKEGSRIRISKICIKDINKQRNYYNNENNIIITTNYDDILEDSSINCIIELIGGITDAKDIILKAIHLNKHVITANKAIISRYMNEINHLLQQHPNVYFAYEAAVCGGIPIINTLQTTYLVDHIYKIQGIMNGTTNFMLGQMKDGINYNQVLQIAQSLGYAEADPSADVEGYDVQSKIIILAKLAFGTLVPLEMVPTQGITSIEMIDFEYCKQSNSTIKLLGTAINDTSQGISVYVTPTIIPLTSPIAHINQANNIVVIESENLLTSTFTGPGAGRFPTANSVVSDIIRIANNQCPKPFPEKISSINIVNDYSSRFYIRFTLSNESNLTTINEILIDVSNHLPFQILSKELKNDKYLIIITDTTSFQKVKNHYQDITSYLNTTFSTSIILPFL